VQVGMEISMIDEENLWIRDRVRSFLADCADRFDGPGRLLDIAPREYESAATHFRQAHISTLDSDAESGATYIADLCRRNDDLLPAGSFDWIVCAGTLTHVRDPFAAIAEIRRLLKPGGHAFFTTSSSGPIDRRVPEYWRFTEHGLRAILSDFTVVSLEQSGTGGSPRTSDHYQAIARKEHSAARDSLPAAPEFSVLITCYYEELSIEEFHARLSKALRSLGRSFEIVFVNDGSTDRTFEKLGEIFERDADVSVIMDLFRNAGQLAAITAALCEARGRAVLLMDSDLQLAPEEIPLLVAEYDKGYDVVSGARVNRKDSWLRIVPSKLANVVMRKATRSEFRDFGCTFKIYDAKLLRGFDYGPHRLFSTVDTIARAGRRREIPVTHCPRKYGKSGWTFQKLLKFNSDNLVSLSERPFQILAGLCLAVAALFSVRILLSYVFPFRILGSVSNGLLLNAILISLLISLGVLCMIGEFAIRSFLIGRNLPFYVVRQVRRRPPNIDAGIPERK
jgi:glycosyltransferase involved in cell wall biosynthesis